MAQLHFRLAALHPVALLYLRRPEEPPADEALYTRCALVQEVMIPGNAVTAVQRRRRDLQAQLSLLRGIPLWVSYMRSTKYAKTVRDTVAEWQPDIVQIEYHIMGQYVEALGRSPVRTVLRQHEPGAATARDRNSQWRGLGHAVGALDCSVWRRYERDLMQRVDAVVALTAQDLADMRTLAPSATFARIPLGIDIPDLPSDPVGASPPHLLFVGNFVHSPNVAAAERLAQRIFPRVRAAQPEVRLIIVGPNPPASLRNLESAGITASGEVPDVGPFMDTAAVVVVPIDRGGGMRVKLAEALAAGKAVVASPQAVEGFDVISGEQLLIGQNDEDFAQACLSLLGDPALRARLGARARAWALEHLGWDPPVAAFERLYDTLIR
jgi:glycosyltransferase involved in cell wall biosynthesis